MSESSGTVREISLGDNFDGVVSVNGTRLEIRHDSAIDVYTSGAVRVHPAFDGDAKPRAISGATPGDRISDGTIFAGISPDTNEPMYTTPADAPLTYTFNQAQRHAARLDAHGRHDWRVPTKKELDVLFDNRAAIGGFKVSGSIPAGLYWSSSQMGTSFFGWTERFSDGAQNAEPRNVDASLRCVR